jgi:hypothetical protein
MKTLWGSTALALVVGFGLAAASGPAAAQQEEDVFANPSVCDADANGMLSETEASDCAERGWTSWTDEDALTEEEFGEVWSGDNSSEVFAEVDADGDGNLSSEEWMAWHEEQFAASALETGGEMPTEAFTEWFGNQDFGVSTDPNE